MRLRMFAFSSVRLALRLYVCGLRAVGVLVRLAGVRGSIYVNCPRIEFRFDWGCPLPIVTYPFVHSFKWF
jgi:hypothetical protein